MRRCFPLLSALILQSCNDTTVGEYSAALSSVDHAFVQEIALEGSATHADATHPIGAFFGSMYSFPDDPNSYVWGFGGVTHGWFRNLTSQGWRLNGDDTWLTDADNSWLDIPPANGRAGFGLVGLANGMILAVGGRHQGVVEGGIPYWRDRHRGRLRPRRSRLVQPGQAAQPVERRHRTLLLRNRLRRRLHRFADVRDRRLRDRQWATE
jgi:hypothetical protein